MNPQSRLWVSALEATANAVVITYRDGTICWANGAFCRLTGYALEEIVGENPRVLRSGQFDAAYYRHMWDDLLAGNTWQDEFVNRRKDGSLYHAEETITPVRSGSGDITHFIGVAIDLTRRQAREREIARLNRLYAVLSAVNQTVLRTQTREALFDRVSRAAVELGGFRLAWIGWHDAATRSIRPVVKAGAGTGFIEDILLSSDSAEPHGDGPTGKAIREGRPVIVNDIAHDELAQKWRDPAAQYGLRASAAFPVRRDGEVCGVLCVYSGETGEFGEKEVHLLAEVAEDVSFALDHLAAEQRRRQMEESHRRLATIVDVSDDAIVSRALDGTVLTWNRGAERIYGYAAAEIVGHSQNILVPRNRTDEITAIDARLRAGESLPTFETVRQRKDGREIQVAVTVSPLRDERGDVVGAATIARDITEQKSLAAQFLRAQRLESIGELASGIAHDLNNILTPVRLAAPMLRSEVSGAHAQNLLDVLEASVSRGSQIIRQVLSFARGTAGAKAPLQTRHLMREIAEILEQTLPKSIQVEGRFPRDLWPVEAEATQLHQVFMNLCVNARDAMPHGGVLTLSGENVEIDAASAARHKKASPGRYVVWLVADTGVGIPAENLGKVFEAFYTTKEPGKGTGLGLSTVLRIVREYDGFVDVTSRPDEGTQFRVYLPAALSEEARPGSVHPVSPNGHGELVLLVDDEFCVREMVERVLSAHNYRVLVAGSGAEAQEQFRAHADEIALLVTDVVMPGMSGAELIKLLRGLAPNLKVVAISGILERSARGASSIDIVADGFLHKPFVMDELLATIADVLKRERRASGFGS